MAQQIKLRRDTAANFTSANPVLGSGEPGYETDTFKMKIGDGSTAFTSLSYLLDQGLLTTSSPTFANLTLDTNDNTKALNIDHEGTTTGAVLVSSTTTTDSAIVVNTAGLTSGTALELNANAAVLTGNVLLAFSNSVTTGTIANFQQNNASGTGSAISVVNAGSGSALTLSGAGAVVEMAQVSAPGVTTNKLYNVGGNLFWNGTQLN